MKIKILFLCMVLTVLGAASVFAETQSDGYIVKVAGRGGVKLFSTLGIAGRELGNTGDMFFVPDDQELTALKSAATIEYIEPNYKVSLLSEPTDDYYPLQRNLSLTKIQHAWEIGCYGNDVKVGVIDSGINAHPDIAENLVSGYNYLGKNSNTTDNIGHGTFVGGVISAGRNGYGIVGGAYRAKVVPVKCFDKDVDTYISTIIEGIYGAVDEFGCDVINISAGVDEESQALVEAVDYAADKGVILVASVGNYGSEKYYYPAGCGNAIGVGSVSNSKKVSSFSQRNGTVFVVAPGENVAGLGLENTYVYGTGTSYSAPLVAGMAAVAKCVDRGMDTDTFKAMLIGSAEDLGEAGYDTSYGHGLVNMEVYLERMLETTELFVSPVDRLPGNKAVVKIYNNTGAVRSCVSIWSDYRDQGVNGLAVETFSIDPKKAVDSEYSGDYRLLRHFLWDSIDFLRPLYRVRESIGML